MMLFVAAKITGTQ